MKTRTSVSKEPDGESGRKPEGTAHRPEDLFNKDSNNTLVIQLSKEKKSKRKSSKEKFSKLLRSENDFDAFTKSSKTTRVSLESTKGDISNSRSSSDSSNSPKSSKKSGGKKGRSLDLVVRRMLKAKKESGGHWISCEADEIKSNETSINTSTADESVDHQIVCRKGESIRYEAADRKLGASVTDKGMIDVQLSSASHLPKSETNSSNRTLHALRTDLSTNDLNDSYCNQGFSPNTGSDNEGSCIKPFVQSPSTLEIDQQQQEGTKDMSPIIKQEPVAAANSRVAMYHQNGPGHSPSSSYNSHPSPDRRSSTPNSPVERSALPSPPELLSSRGMQQFNSHNAEMLMLNGGMNSRIPAMMSDPFVYSRRSPNNRSPHSNVTDLGYPPVTSGVTVAAMVASGIGLPTLVPTVSAIPPSTSQHMFRMDDGMVTMAHSDASRCIDGPSRRIGSESAGIKVSPNAPAGPNPPRGIVGQKEAAAANVSRGGRRGGANVDEKCQYKRPPHTYPALIASAILDSPGNLITLRGIYDYIMNNFPYYKFGHDKSAWQNSIRHNLSLNQCFVKVPRYENAAKSNYWTMTSEGFEEFGNENSFKRRRRRGAALAPISAYKNKKSNNEGSKSNKLRGSPVGNGSLTNTVALSVSGWPGRSRTPEPAVNYKGDSHGIGKVMKRTGSPGAELGAKRPRMMVLKPGEGPALEGLSGRGDHPQRPNSLSSVEEMQGNLNSFSKSLSAATDNSYPDVTSRRTDGNSHADILRQQWMMAAMQKNLNLFPPGILTSSPPPLLATHDRYPSDGQRKSPANRSGGMRTPVLFEGIEIGYQVPLYVGNICSAPALSYSCRFCEYSRVDDNSEALEKHCQMLHPLDITNARAKAVAAAAVAGHRRGLETRTKSPGSRQDHSSSPMSLPNMVPGLSPSMIAAAASYNSAQNFLAAAQAAGLGLPMPTISNVVTSAPSHFADSLTRALAQHIGSGSSENLADTVVNTTRQQLGASESTNLPQDQLRQLIYQQLMTQSPFFPGNPSLTATIPRTTPSGHSDMAQLAQLWQYQQKVLEMAAQGAKEKALQKEETPTKNHSSNVLQSRSPNRNRKESSSSNCSRQNEQTYDVEAGDKQDDIHGWKQCQDCDFTAKGAHGLELHFRKVHVNEARKDVGKNYSPSQNEEQEGNAAIKIGSSAEQDTTGDPKQGKELALFSSIQSKGIECGTQTASEEEKRTCEYCDVTFGDDTMYALHMTCHDRESPFKCKICAQDCHEKYYFNVHLLRGLHQPNHSSNEKKHNSVRLIERLSSTGEKDDSTNEKNTESAVPCGANQPHDNTLDKEQGS